MKSGFDRAAPQLGHPSSGADPRYLIPHFLEVKGTTLVRHPDALDPRWVAQWFAIQFAVGGSLAPFQDARRGVVRWMTTQPDCAETLQVTRALCAESDTPKLEDWLLPKHV